LNAGVSTALPSGPTESGPIASARVVSRVTRRIDGRGPAATDVADEDGALRPQAARSRTAAHAAARGRQPVNVRIVSRMLPFDQTAESATVGFPPVAFTLEGSTPQ